MDMSLEEMMERRPAFTDNMVKALESRGVEFDEVDFPVEAFRHWAREYGVNPILFRLEAKPANEPLVPPRLDEFHKKLNDDITATLSEAMGRERLTLRSADDRYLCHYVVGAFSDLGEWRDAFIQSYYRPDFLSTKPVSFPMAVFPDGQIYLRRDIVAPAVMLAENLDDVGLENAIGRVADLVLENPGKIQEMGKALMTADLFPTQDNLEAKLAGLKAPLGSPVMAIDVQRTIKRIEADIVPHVHLYEKVADALEAHAEALEDELTLGLLSRAEKTAQPGEFCFRRGMKP